MSFEQIVGVAAIVGVVLAGIQVLQGRRRHRREDGDATGVRTQALFEESAVALGDMASTLTKLRGHVELLGENLSSDWMDKLQDLENECRGLNRLLSRMRVTRGVSSPEAVEFQKATETWLGGYSNGCCRPPRKLAVGSWGERPFQASSQTSPTC